MVPVAWTACEVLGFPSTFKETKTETGSGLHGASGLETLEIQPSCAGLGTGLSAAEKRGAGSSRMDTRESRK